MKKNIIKSKTIKIILPTLAIGLTVGAIIATSVASNIANRRTEDNTQNDQLGNQPSFAIPGGWNKVIVNNYYVTPLCGSYPGLTTKNDLQINKDGYLFQIDNIGGQNWSKYGKADQWMTFREAILNDGQQLISNIKVGMSAHTDDDILTWGSIIGTTHFPPIFPLPSRDVTTSNKCYAINDNQWDVHNGNWANPHDALIGSSFTWHADTVNFIYNATNQATGHFNYTMHILDDNNQPISIYDCVQIKQTTSGQYLLQLKQSFHTMVTIDTAFDDSIYVNAGGYGGDVPSTTYVDGAEIPNDTATDIFTSQMFNNSANVGSVMNANFVLTQKETDYFKNNSTTISQTIPIDADHFKLQKFDGAFINDNNDGKDSVVWYLRTYAAKIDADNTYLYWGPIPVPWQFSGDLQLPSIKLSSSSSSPACLTFYNFQDGYHDGFSVYSSILLSTGFAIEFNYDI